MNIRSKYEAYRRKKILQHLRNTPAEKFHQALRKKLVPTFKQACQDSPAYNSLISESKLIPADISTINQFSEKVPITNKNNYFTRYDLSELAGKNRDAIKLAMTSSGFSGTFAYGFGKEGSLKKGRIGIDTTLDYWFDISNRKTFLINCAPMGVHVETSLPLAEVSVRSDMAIALLQKVSPLYDQTILIGDPNFLKKLVEEGMQINLNWSKLNVSLITAQDWLPESLRSYLANMLEIDLEKPGSRGIYATMGMTELGLNVFHESKYTVSLRRSVMKNESLREKLVSSPMQAPPCFFHYYPFRTYIETLGSSEQQEFLFTLLDKDGIVPIIRYQTGDRGDLIDYDTLSSLLGKQYNSLLPDLKLPIGIMSGRMNNAFETEGHIAFLEDVKEGLFADIALASKITGLTGMKIIDKKLHILIHLKKGINLTAQLQAQVEEAAHTYIHGKAVVKLYEYYALPDAIELNYEKKLFLR